MEEGIRSHESQSAEIVKSYVQNLTNKLCQDIDNEILEIAYPGHVGLHKINKIRDTINQIRTEKANLLQKLSQLESDQAELRKASHKQSPRKKEISRLTKQQSKLLKKLQRQYEMYQHALVEKTEKYNKRLAEEKQKRQRQEQQRMEKERIRRRQEAKNHIQNKKKKQWPKHASMKSTLYKKMQESWIIRQEQQEHKISQLKQELKKQKCVDFQEIKKHQQKYQQLFKRKRDECSKRLKNQIKQCEKRSRDLTQPSVFYKRWKEEQDGIEAKSMDKEAETKQLVQKRIQYSKSVKHTIFPKIKCKPMEQGGTAETKTPLSYFQQLQVGNDYLAQSKKAIKKRQSQSFNDQNTVMPTQTKVNYLKHHGQKTEDSEKIKSLCQNKNMNVEKMAEQARYITQKMDSQAKHDPMKILKCIQAKLNIINRLQQ